MIGNTTLIEYGIQNEDTDIRAHVGVLAATVYVYPTQTGKRLIESGRYEQKPVKTGNIITALGCVVPWRDIPGVKTIAIPDSWMQKISFGVLDSTTVKGEKAVKIVSGMLKQGMFPLPVDPRVINESQLQISGLDILVELRTKIQVKCDYRGGGSKPICTGNLFLQTHECNPWGQH